MEVAIDMSHDAVDGVAFHVTNKAVVIWFGVSRKIQLNNVLDSNEPNIRQSFNGCL